MSKVQDYLSTETDENGREWYIINGITQCIIETFPTETFADVDRYQKKIGAHRVKGLFLGGGFGFPTEAHAVQGLEKLRELAKKEGTECFRNGHTIDIEDVEPEEFVGCSVCGVVVGYACGGGSPSGMCEYNEETDPCLDDCLYCHLPAERK